MVHGDKHVGGAQSVKRNWLVKVRGLQDEMGDWGRGGPGLGEGMEAWRKWMGRVKWDHKRWKRKRQKGVDEILWGKRMRTGRPVMRGRVGGHVTRSGNGRNRGGRGQKEGGGDEMRGIATYLKVVVCEGVSGAGPEGRGHFASSKTTSTTSTSTEEGPVLSTREVLQGGEGGGGTPGDAETRTESSATGGATATEAESTRTEEVSNPGRRPGKRRRLQTRTLHDMGWRTDTADGGVEGTAPGITGVKRGHAVSRSTDADLLDTG